MSFSFTLVCRPRTGYLVCTSWPCGVFGLQAPCCSNNNSLLSGLAWAATRSFALEKSMRPRKSAPRSVFGSTARLSFPPFFQSLSHRTPCTITIASLALAAIPQPCRPTTASGRKLCFLPSETVAEAVTPPAAFLPREQVRRPCTRILRDAMFHVRAFLTSHKSPISASQQCCKTLGDLLLNLSTTTWTRE